MDSAAGTNPFLPMFLAFRDELDQHHDRRERIIKASRDITALSKKMIFSLQRFPPSFPLLPCPCSSARLRAAALIASHSARRFKAPLPTPLQAEIASRQAEINAHLTAIGPDLQSLNAHRYRQISGGLQELVEALCFHHYLTSGTLLSHAAAQAMVPGGIELAAADYVLGVFDFVGEVMRFGITMMALGGGGGGGGGGGEDTAAHSRILLDLRRLREEFERLDSFATGAFLGREADRKMVVMKQCVEKVETAVYGVIVRGSEKPKGWVPDLDAPAGRYEPTME